jgi:archaellum component FlaF (FlaF/FlaG flagellin family)
MHRSRIGTTRALSEIPSAAMLMFAVAVMGIFLLTWSNQTMNLAAMELTDSYDGKINRLSEEISIEHVWFGTGSSNKFVNVTVSNISNIGITLTEIELVNSTKTHTITTTQSLLPGDTYSIEEVYVWTSGTPVDVTVITARENHFKTQVSP